MNAASGAGFGLVAVALAVGWVAPAHAGGYGLAEIPPSRVELPRSALGDPPIDIAVDGPFRLAGVVGNVRTYEAPLPIRPRALFYEREPMGLELSKEGRKLAYSADPVTRGMAGGWEINGDSIMVRLRVDTPRPRPGQYTLRYAAATERESALRFQGGDEAAWALRSTQVDATSRNGILLPAPALASWRLDITPGSRLRLELAVLPPEIEEGPTSDGADLAVLVDGVEVASFRASVGLFAQREVELPAGKHEIILQSRDDDTTLDHLFVAAPTVFIPSARPQRVVLAFIDTLRQDHLGTYGYARDTSPDIDRWAEGAVVFENARTVAPWTLPSTRSLWTGRQPEWWHESSTLQEALAERGWATGAYVGNVYLSSNFEMDRGWGEHHCVNWPGAAYETFRGQSFLDAHADQDALLMVHFMDLHLPYKEPARYRRLWAREDPPGLEPYFNRTMLLNAAMRQRDRIVPYLLDRYDQNLRYVNDTLGALLADLPADATVVLFADHGEEFFDHGDFEHGHTLYDELLRVPLVIKSPALGPNRVADAASLLDVAPTLLELLGLPADTLGPQEGTSLVRAARDGSDATLANRALAFGRALYNGEQWASLQGNEKYITTRGRELLFNVSNDRGEQVDLAARGNDVRPGRVALATALGRDVVQALRLSPTGRPETPIEVELEVPGGVERAWAADDPTSITLAAVDIATPNLVKMVFESRLKENREVFVVPKLPADEVVGQVGIRLVGKMKYFELLKPRVHDGSGAVLSRARAGAISALVTWAIVPVPAGRGTEGSDAEMAGALEALGYMQGAAPDEPGHDEDPPAGATAQPDEKP